jgi:deoxyribodipyrimidine photo-lyase
MQIHWHRRDLRVSDSLGLAATDDDACGLFVFDPGVLAHGASPRLSFLLDGVRTLRERYRERGGDLLVARGRPRELLPALAEDLGAETVTWARDYSGLARERDSAVRQALADAGVERQAIHDAVHQKPGSITTNDGDPYKVFTYFSKKWHDREKRDPVEAPDGDALVSTDDDRLATARASEFVLDGVPTLADLGFDEPEASIPPAGTDAARERLREFCESDIYRYDERRDYPADSCTSGLSPHLSYGTIGIREVYRATERAEADADGEDERESVFEFQDQLAWREFYTQVLWDRPDVVAQNYKSYENPIDWRDDEQALQAWKNGETGYPIVDAGMRQLRAEAYMHNRLRMIVASFLTKDLLIDWREGYDWFRSKLVDHDTANNNGGWQWAASTGTDAQPYFRIFNPMTQGERYDPDAEYIKKYIPELSDVPAETIHSWHELDEGTRQMHAPAYPAPIVDHGERREQALTMYKRARGET